MGSGGDARGLCEYGETLTAATSAEDSRAGSRRPRERPSDGRELLFLCTSSATLSADFSPTDSPTPRGIRGHTCQLPS